LLVEEAGRMPASQKWARRRKDAGMSRKTWSAMALALLVSGGSALADSVWVQNDNTNILGGKGSIYPTVANVKKGTELQVLSRDGKWVQVQLAGGQSGWVYETALSSKKVGGDLFSGLRGNDAVGLNTAAAARGFDESTLQYAASKGMSKAGMDRLLAIKKSIQPAEWEAFNRAVLMAAGMPVPPMSAQQTPVTAPLPQTPGYTPQTPQQPSYTPQQQPSYTPQQPYVPQQPIQPRPPVQNAPRVPGFVPQQVVPPQLRPPTYTPQQPPAVPQVPPSMQPR
jgi:uncharacterized protein YraI